MRFIARSASIGDRALDLGRRRGLLVVLLLTVLALAGAANAAGASPRHSPTLLWKTYPLVQRPASADARSRAFAFAAGVPPALPLQAQPGGGGMLSRTMLFLLLGSLVAAAGGVLMVRSALAEVRDDASRSDRR